MKVHERTASKYLYAQSSVISVIYRLGVTVKTSGRFGKVRDPLRS
jgi:hypothetical protein